jgi:integrase
MVYHLHAPGTRKGNQFFIIRGTLHDATGRGHRFEARTRTTDKVEADRFALAYVADLQKELDADAGPKRFFHEAADAYIALKKPRKLDLVAIQRLKDHFGPKKLLTEVAPADFVAAANALLPQGSNAHKNRTVLTPGAAIMHYAAKQLWCPYLRFDRFKVSRKSSRKPAAAGTVQKLLEATTGHKHLLLAWLYETGQRITDSVQLRDEQLDLPNGKAFMKSSKNDDGAFIDLSPALVSLLATTPRCEGGKVFPWNSRWSVYKWLRKLVADLGLHYTPHLSRHALATDLRALGWDMRDIALRGAWRDERSAGRYVHDHAPGTAGRSVDSLIAGQPAGQTTVSG